MTTFGPYGREPELESVLCVATVLSVDPFDVWQIGPDASEDGNAQLILKIDGLVEALKEVATRSYDFCAKAKKYRERLAYCDAVLDGKIAPVRGLCGQFVVPPGLGRGIYPPLAGDVLERLRKGSI